MKNIYQLAMSTPVVHSSKEKTEIKYEEWMESLTKDRAISRNDMNKLIMNYFLTEGFKESAEKFCLESGTPYNVDISHLDDIVKMREAIENGDIENVILLINEKYPELLDDEPYLFFHLQQQQLIELIRNKKIEDALVFAQNNLAEYGESSTEVLDDLEKTLALLAFDEPEKSPFGDLLSLNQRQKVAGELISIISRVENKPNEPSLSHTLKLLLWTQQELSNKKIMYPKMTDLSEGKIISNSTDPKSSQGENK